MKKALTVVLVVAACLCVAHGASAAITVLHNFTAPPGDGALPQGPPLLLGGKLYGLTHNGGLNDMGCMYSLAPDGSAFLLGFSFPAPVGWPTGALVSDGTKLYGTAEGGPVHDGEVFSLFPDGTGHTTLHTFGTPNDGSMPEGGLVLGGTTLYGVTNKGGTGSHGTVFSIGTNGSGYTVLHHFAGTPGDGASPWQDLTLVGDTLYGVTMEGGASDKGAAFSMKTDGTAFTILRSFQGGPGDGSNPRCGLLYSAGKLYGMTSDGGTGLPDPGFGTVFSMNSDGSGYTILHNFAGSPNDGAYPVENFVLDGSRLYGITGSGGPNGVPDGGYGTLFTIDTSGGNYSILHNFAGQPNEGKNPVGIVSDGATLFGTTAFGGTDDHGTVFSQALPVLPLQVRVNSADLKAGDQFTVNVTVQPLAQPFDVWAVIMGQNAIYSMVFNKPTAIMSGAQPMLRGVASLPQLFSDQLLNLTIPPGAAGTYQVIVGLVPPGIAPTGVQSAIAGYVDQVPVQVR